MNPIKKQLIKTNVTVGGILFYIQICNTRDDAYAIIQDASFRSLISLNQQEKLLKFADIQKKKTSNSNSQTKTISLNDGIRRFGSSDENTLKYAAFVSAKMIVTVVIIAVLLIAALFLFL